ncbi:amidase family protein [Geomicrobium sp. JCM 19038]|uniref:amidase family protein n=1 Tax=Geomicrobium sp. JCM 19038 TaxID=1460635 RepID=UPI00045F3E98|nr:amidase family protein [Geomicrobium sp. JCM 19038]GAK08842.1 aspartyl-tRNA(Asn) amidotransferase subunit A [Geomicrobium sp. JCM 19038]
MAGDTYNAVDRALAPGGSSSGTATAISGNFAVLGVAEETGGSIQNPAAAQSLVSVKPSFGLVPNTGTTPLAANTRDVLGPHSRSVEDAAIMLDVTAGYTVQDPKTIAAIGNIPADGYADDLSEDSLEGKRIGLYGEGWRDEALSEETEELYERSIEELEALGAEVVEDPFADSGFIDVMEQYGNIGYEALVSDFQAYLDRLNPSGDLPSIAELFEQAEEVPWAEGGPLAHFGNRGVDFEKDLQNPYDIPEQVEFTKARTAYLHIVDQVIEEHDLDGFVYPQMSEEIPNLHEGDHSATTVPEINMSGLPLVTVPAGNYESGSPFSLAFFGEMWSEQDLLAMAYSYEQDTNYREAPVLEQPEQDESVIRNIQPTEDQTLQAGESVRVSFAGEPGLEASFAIRIPLFTRAAAPTEIMMREVEEGYYEGYWTATNNLQVDGAEIEIKAINQEGQEFREVAEGRLSIEQ